MSWYPSEHVDFQAMYYAALEEVKQLKTENRNLQLELQQQQRLELQQQRQRNLINLHHTQPGSLNIQNSLPFERKVLSLGTQGSIRICHNEFQNINMKHEGKDLAGDYNVFLKQFSPMIIEDVRSAAHEKLREIERFDIEPISGAVISTSHGDETQSTRHNQRTEQGCVSLSCSSPVHEFPKLDHGFMKELLCVVLPSNDKDPKKQKFILAIGSKETVKDDHEYDQKERYTVLMLAHDYSVLLGHVRNCNRKLNHETEACSLQHIAWHHLTGLIPASRMYEATTPKEIFPLAKQLLLQQPVAWPLSQNDESCEGLNVTQAKVVQSMAGTGEGGMFYLIGPPGTGKTTTITQLLLARMRHFPQEKILLTAPSNKAIQVVLHKLVQHNTEEYAIAVIGTGKGAAPEHEQYYAAECLTPMISDLKALRKSSHHLHERTWKFQAILDRASEHLLHVMCPTRKSLEVSRETKQRAQAAQVEINSCDLSTITDADSFKKKLSACIGLLYRAGECIENYILERAQVIFGTLVASGRKSLFKVVKKFHTVIVDEAAQALMAETFIPFKFNPVRYLLVGDPNQLPATVSSPALKHIGYANSLMYVMEDEMGERSCAEMLTTQYRMSPSTCKPISDLFYGGKLVTDASVLSRQCLRQKHLPVNMLLRDVPCAFVDLDSTECKVNDGSISNYDEAELVVKVVLYLLDNKIKPNQIGVVTSYNAQAELLKNLLQKYRRNVHNLTISSVDGFQGGEKDFMLFSCVRTSKSVGFMDDKRRINVAMSRGRYANWVFGQARTWRMSNSPLQRFINWIEDEQRNNLSPRPVVIQADVLLESMQALLAVVGAVDCGLSTAPLTSAVPTPPARPPTSTQSAVPLVAAHSNASRGKSTDGPPASQDTQRRSIAAGGTNAPSPHATVSAVRQRGPPSEYTPPVAVSPPALPLSTAAGVASTVVDAKPVESTPIAEPTAPVRNSNKKNRGKVLLGPAMSTSRK